MADLDSILARLPDNTTGAIDADDIRYAVEGLWDYTTQVHGELNEVVVTGLPAAQSAITDLQAQADALTARVAALEGA